ncbi:MAG TPA: hypothetical protein VFU69_16255, partial [Ktedonobacterales bacterium]|nr:hypothetical protein [Ktedonobacterales bacterium]
SLLAAAPDERPALAAGLRERAMGMDTLLARPISPDDIIARFEALVQQRYAVTWQELAVPAALDTLARAQERERYAPMLDSAAVNERS